MHGDGRELECTETLLFSPNFLGLEKGFGGRSF